MSEQQLNYRSIFKATSLFGGVQLYQILVQVIRSKFLALFLGTTGMGINGLYSSTLDLIKKITSLGLSQSAVRDISEASSTRDYETISRTVIVLRRLVWFTGALGTIVVLVLSPLLSKVAFGNYDFAVPFAILSITLLLDQVSAGQKVILQGTRRLKDLARASAIGSTIGLFISIPLYYFFRINGLVPTLVLNSLTMLGLSWFYSRRIKVKPIPVNNHEVLEGGATMLKMGIAMTISGALTAFSSFVIRWFIRTEGGVEIVGLFQAGFVIVNNYVGLVFSALGTDFYPRLAGVSKDNNACMQIVNQQGEVAVLLIGPIICFCLVLMPIFVILLYTRAFLDVNSFIIWALLGLLFKLLSWLVAFQFIAKGESRLFIINESAVNLYQLVFFYLGFRFWGLSGLGVAYALTYLVYSIQVYVIANHRYGFTFSPSFRKEYSIQLFLAILCLLAVLLPINWMKFLFGGIVLFVSVVVSYKGLDNRLDISSFLKRKINGA